MATREHKKKRMEKMRRNQTIPGDDWQKLPCKVRPTGPIQTFEEGIAMEKRVADLSDTEAEQS